MTRVTTPAMAVGLGLLLLTLSYVRILGDARSAAFGGSVIDAAIAGGIWGTTLGNNLLLFAATQILVHVIFAFVCWGLARISRIAWPTSSHSERTWLLLWFMLCALWLLIANAALFPWSSLGSMHFEYALAQWHGISLFRAYSGALLAGLSWLGICAARQIHFARQLTFTRTGGALLAIACAGLMQVGLARHAKPPKSSKPHVILIGVDSLRNDFVESPRQRTPALDDFLRSAIRFTDAITPLARTFPSWVSIISGKNPHTTGAVINLLPRDLIHTGDTLPSLLSRNGYQSVYAIDEVRFSNLDRSYGFDRTITPPIGATDFLLGFFGDTPLSNLLVNTRIGGLLFPHMHANRAIAHAYDPDSFISRLDRELDFNRPTFLAAHLTLAHWPYYWADAPTNPSSAHDGTSRRIYESAITRVDKQFGALLAVLKKRGALENAIVIVISDHGESLGLIDSTDQPADSSIGVQYEESHLVGHGTSVFAPSQYKVVFAMRSYGNAVIADNHARIDAPVSLEDLAPTLLELLSIQTRSPFDGRSLAPLLAGNEPKELAARIRFTETEFNPKGFTTGALISASAMQQAAAYYRVDSKSDRVMVRRELLSTVLQRRQFAALKGDKMLAVVPIETSEGLIRRTILVKDGCQPVVVADPGNGEGDVRELWTALNSRFPGLQPEHPSTSAQAVGGSP